MKAEQITGADAGHGEGPVWWPGWGGLRWVDMLAGDILHLDPSSGAVERWHVGTVAAALRPRRGGGLVIATEHEFAVAGEAGGALTVLATPVADPAIRFNDGGCDPRGAFLCGTMAYSQAAGAGTLYRLTPDHRVGVVLDGVTISNGLAWTADGTRTYYVDTPTQRIDLLDLDGPEVTRRPFVEIPADRGAPDGLTVDAEGGVWVALWGGAAVHRYCADGVLDAVVELPVDKVTACTFGGEHLDQLFITTSRNGETDPRAAAGALFRVDTGVRGLPAATFAG